MIQIQLPHDIEEQLRRDLGDLDQAARQALAVEAYRTGKLSLGEFAEMLQLTTDEADGLLKERGIYLDVTLPELEQDLATLRELLSQ